MKEHELNKALNKARLNFSSFKQPYMASPILFKIIVSNTTL